MDNKADTNRNNNADRIPRDEEKIYGKSSPAADPLSYSPRFEKENSDARNVSSASAHTGVPGSRDTHTHSSSDRSSRKPNDKHSQSSQSSHNAHNAHNAHKDGRSKSVYYSRTGTAEPLPQKNGSRKKPARAHSHAKSRARLINGGETEKDENYRKLQHERNIAGLKRTLIIFAVLLAVLFAAYGVYRLTNVREITITGSDKYDSSHIKDICGIQTGHNIFSYDLKDISEKINTVPELTVVSAKRHFPNKIEILVSDHEPRAAVPAGNGTYTVIDADGFVMSIGKKDTDGLIVIRGLASKSFKPGSQLNQAGNPDLRSAAALEFIKWIDASKMDDIVIGIDVSNISCVKLLLKNNFTAVLGTYPEATDNLQKAKKAYGILLPVYPKGGIINVFDNSTQVDFTPNKD